MQSGLWKHSGSSLYGSKIGWRCNCQHHPGIALPAGSLVAAAMAHQLLHCGGRMADILSGLSGRLTWSVIFTNLLMMTSIMRVQHRLYIGYVLPKASSRCIMLHGLYACSLLRSQISKMTYDMSMCMMQTVCMPCTSLRNVHCRRAHANGLRTPGCR